MVVYAAPSRQATRAARPFVLVLVGMPGSGKSFFATRLESSSGRAFVRINQDSLGTRGKCEEMARRVLAEGRVAVIDRCNFDVDQRATWIGIAREMRVDCECVVFHYDKDVCISRCAQRRGHETIHPSKAAGVVSVMFGKYRPPTPRSRRDGHVQCVGERFLRLEHVASFNEADRLAQSYLTRG